MRKVTKGAIPTVLADNKETWDAAVAQNPSDYNKNRYRDPAIKAALIAETHCKCVYCESKIGHNCPGDIEHKIPKSKMPERRFDWDNMTIGCTECNRRKLDYYDPDCMFLDPNKDDVESLVIHVGPLVFHRPGNPRSEVTIRILELDNASRRPQLFDRKYEKLEAVRNLVERVSTEKNEVLRRELRRVLLDWASEDSEFSGMVAAYLDRAKAVSGAAEVTISELGSPPFLRQ